MTTILKRILLGLAIAFALYYIFTQPEQTANVVKSFFGGVARLFHALVG